MKLQKATRFALYSVLECARDAPRQVSATEIAQKYEVSIHHLSKVLRELGRAGILEAARGVGGGYRFTGNPRRLALMDVIALFEDISSRSGAGHEQGARTDIGQGLGVVLGEIDEIAKATFRSITVDTMLRLVERRKRAG